MGYFPVRCNSRVVIYERKMFIRLVTGGMVLLYSVYKPCLFILIGSGENRSPPTLTVSYSLIIASKRPQFLIESRC